MWSGTFSKHSSFVTLVQLIPDPVFFILCSLVFVEDARMAQLKFKGCGYNFTKNAMHCRIRGEPNPNYSKLLNEHKASHASAGRC